MSDHWETFPCTIGERPAFITYDHGVRQEIETLPYPNYTRFEIALKNPDERGLPRGDEFGATNAVEDQLAEAIGVELGLNVGRITTNGRRYVLFYTWLDASTAESIGKSTSASSGYDITLSHRPDAERHGYWNELFPTDDDWQVIKDIRVEDALRDRGDDLSEPRPITHWSYFPDASSREQFVATVKNSFSQVELYESPDNERGIYTAQLTHTGRPDYRSMNSVTLLLRRTAERFGGDYDGWETEIRQR